MYENLNEHRGELHLRLGEESCDPPMIEWLSYAMGEVFLWTCSRRTPPLSSFIFHTCIPCPGQALLFLVVSKELIDESPG